MKKTVFALTAIVAAAAFVACSPTTSDNVVLDSIPQSVPTPDNHASSSAGYTSTIKVTGRGEAKVSPDTANVWVEIMEYGDTSEQATQASAQKTEQVTQRLHNIGIAAEDIVTEHYGVYPDYASGYYGDNDQIVGYNANTSITFSTKDKDNVGIYIDSISEFDVSIGNVYFSLEDDTEGYTLAMQDASNNALEKATILAEANGRSVGRAVSITEGYTDDMSIIEGYSEPYASEAPMEESESSDSAPTTNISYDTHTIYSTVTVYYELV